MARAAATSDIYNAIAEPRRREILEILGRGERSVGDLVEVLDVGQPAVSKHLGVLREVELVNVRRDGRRRIYSVNPEPLSAVREWVDRFERLWTLQLDAIEARAEGKRRPPPSKEEGT